MDNNKLVRKEYMRCPKILRPGNIVATIYDYSKILFKKDCNLHISQARTKFRLRSFMTKTVKLNFASDRQFAADLWTCWHCPMVDSQSHVRICPAYENLRAGKNLDNDQDLVR